LNSVSSKKLFDECAGVFVIYLTSTTRIPEGGSVIGNPLDRYLIAAPMNSLCSVIDNHVNPEGALAMDRFAKVAIISLFVGLVALSCSESTSDPAAYSLSGEFLDHVNDGCSNLETGAIGSGCVSHLNGYEIEGDTLVLDIHFVANCCPRFSEDISFDNSRVDIVVIDTRYGCDCICPFDNEFSFEFTGSGELHIDFLSAASPDSHIVCVFDTLINIPD
jgi:hypothetical protein